MFKIILIILNTYLLYKQYSFFWSPLQYSNTGIFFQKLLHIFTTDVFPFMFHFYVSTYWISNVSRDETWRFDVSFLVSKFHFLFTTPLSKNTLGEKSKPNGSDLKTQWERNQTQMGETPLKHWNQEWNIEHQCFISWNYWLSMRCAVKMKHETKKRLRVNITYARVRSAIYPV